MKVKKEFVCPVQDLLTRHKLLKIDEAAYCLNIEKATVYNWINAKKLRRTTDKPVRIPVEDVIKLMGELE